MTGADYRSTVGAWLDNHKRYPEAARQRGEQGNAVLRFRVNRSGRVLDYAVVSSTGHTDLDVAVEEMVRDAILPPFPANMSEPEINLTVTIRFDLAGTSPSANGEQAPITGSPSAPTAAMAYAQGTADWHALRAWFGAQVGNRRVGADYWAANRSISNHPTCADAAASKLGDKAAFIAGCEEAKRHLDPIDIRRADPRYRAGFNDEAKRQPFQTEADAVAGKSTEPPPVAPAPMPPDSYGAYVQNLTPAPSTVPLSVPVAPSATAPAATVTAPALTASAQTNVAISKPSPSLSATGEVGVLRWAAVIASFLISIVCLAGYFLYRIAKQQRSDTDVWPNHRDLPPVGANGVVSQPIVNGQGKVRAAGKVWLAQGPNLPSGTQVIIRSVEGAQITVEAMSAERTSASISS